MKLIHTSDWHLGARLHEEDRAAEHKAFLEWLLGQIQEEKPDALLVSGDVFDSAAPSASAMKLYHEFVVRAIHGAGSPAGTIGTSHAGTAGGTDPARKCFRRQSYELPDKTMSTLRRSTGPTTSIMIIRRRIQCLLSLHPPIS